MHRIFLSYRRSDTGGHAHALAQDLEKHYPGEIFRDTGAIEDGDRWDHVIVQALSECLVMLAVIGPDWLAARDPDSGQRRIDIEDDWVRREIETAFARDILVIPVLVGGASRLAEKHRLPKSLQPLIVIEPREIPLRDATGAVALLAEQLCRKIGPGLSVSIPLKDPSTPVVDPLPYLQWLQAKAARIDIRGLATGNNKANTFPIDELYTPLNTVLAPPDIPRTARPEDYRPRPVTLQQALCEQPRLVLVGDPGAGKSTFLRRIAYAVCQELTGSRAGAAGEFLGVPRYTCPFPFLVPAASLSAFVESAKRDRGAPATEHAPEYLVRYLEAASREQGWDFPAVFLRNHLRTGCLLLVDGLDEAPDRRTRKGLARLLEEAGTVYPATRIVATTRPSAYGGETTLSGFTSAEIAPFNNSAISAFVTNWSRLVRPDDPRGYARSLDSAIHSRPEIQEMAVNPVMLTALAVLHWNERRLPERRVELYDSILKWLARAKEDMPRRRTAEQCLELMRSLAFGMHADPRGRQVAISPHAAAVELQPSVPGESEEARYRAAEEFLRDEETNTGILIAREGLLRFWHLTFQEYLAAHVLAVRTRERRRLLFDERRLYLPDWRRTVLLLGGILRTLDKQLIDDFLAAILDAAPHDAPLANRAVPTALISAILDDLSATGYKLEDPRWLSLLGSLEDIFTPEATVIDYQTRLEAAYAIEDGLGLLRGIEMAKAVQGRLMPGLLVRTRTLDCAARCLQTRELGGDYYDFLSLDADRLAIVMADASGKGVAAALSTAEVQGYFRSANRALLDLEASLARLNTYLWKATPTDTYFTLFFGIYDEQVRRLRYGNCGHTPPLCLRRDGRVETLESTTTILGMFETVACPGQEIQLEPGDILVVATDGITEAVNAESEEFGQARLIEAVKSAADLPAEGILDAVLKEVERFSGGQQFDDLTLLVIRVT
jgi:hypothetical protein